jgi:hypothetical protein
MEQVCRALVWVARRYLRRRRGTTETVCLADVLQYHQHRNTVARKSRQKRPRKLRGYPESEGFRKLNGFPEIGPGS